MTSLWVRCSGLWWTAKVERPLMRKSVRRIRTRDRDRAPSKLAPYLDKGTHCKSLRRCFNSSNFKKSIGGNDLSSSALPGIMMDRKSWTSSSGGRAWGEPICPSLDRKLSKVARKVRRVGSLPALIKPLWGSVSHKRIFMKPPWECRQLFLITTCLIMSALWGLPLMMSTKFLDFWPHPCLVRIWNWFILKIHAAFLTTSAFPWPPSNVDIISGGSLLYRSRNRSLRQRHEYDCRWGPNRAPITREMKVRRGRIADWCFIWNYKSVLSWLAKDLHTSQIILLLDSSSSCYSFGKITPLIDRRSHPGVKVESLKAACSFAVRSFLAPLRFFQPLLLPIALSRLIRTRQIVPKDDSPNSTGQKLKSCILRS